MKPTVNESCPNLCEICEKKLAPYELHSECECKHDWVKITNINLDKMWYMIFIYAKQYSRDEKYVCLKCGKTER